MSQLSNIEIFEISATTTDEELNECFEWLKANMVEKNKIKIIINRNDSATNYSKLKTYSKVRQLNKILNGEEFKFDKS